MISDTDGIEGVSIANYTRCYVEDFMTRDIGESVLVLLPSRFADDNFLSCHYLMSTDIKFLDISFTKHNYRGYIGIITTNPILSRVENGMHHSDYTAGFGNHNYGCNVLFEDSDSQTNHITHLCLVT